MRKRNLLKVIYRSTVSLMAVFCSFLLLSKNAYLPANADEDLTVAIAAHRGYSAAYPENTLSAFAGAIAIDAKYIELDVRKTSDNQLVIYHDNTLSKPLGEESELGIADFTYEQLLQLDVGSWYSDEFAMERIPTLDQALDLLSASDATIFVELKEIGEDPEFPSQVYMKVKEHGMLDRVIFSSFNYTYLQGIKEQNYSQPIMKLASSGKTNIVKKYPAEYYGINMKTLTPATIQVIHEAGAKVFSYAPETKGQMLSLQRLGVDGVITDYADVSIL